MLMRKNRGVNWVSIDDASVNGATTLAQEIPDSAANPEQQYAREELEKILTLAVNQLPPGMQTALRLQLEDHTVGEIAEILGVPISAVKARLFRARGKLHQLLNVHFARDWASLHYGTTPVA